MTRYETVVNLDHRNKSQTLTALLVGEDRTVLDVGCATGYLAEALTARGCVVSGLEVDPEAAELARPKLQTLVVADLETTPLADAFAGTSFERIVFADVLEHLQDPAAALRSALQILAPDGEIVISIPNVAHGSLRLALLEGRWTYRELGLLDRTHLRFFTLEGLVDMLASAGLTILEAWSTTADVLATEIDIAPDALPDGLIDWVRHQPHALDYQFVVRVGRGEPGAQPPVVHQAVPAIDIRPDDEYAQQARRSVVEDHEALRLRDQVAGLAATLANVERAAADRVTEATTRAVSAQVATESLESRLAHRERMAKDLRSKLNAALKERDAIRSSRTWRVARALTAPLRLTRKLLG